MIHYLTDGGQGHGSIVQSRVVKEVSTDERSCACAVWDKMNKLPLIILHVMVKKNQTRLRHVTTEIVARDPRDGLLVNGQRYD